MVEEDPERVIFCRLVAKGIFNLRLVPSLGTGEVVVPHGNGNVAGPICLVVLEDDI